MKYFAYGSNMSLPRLTARVASAERIGVFRLAEHTLRFHKVGKDGSGKCDAYYTGYAEDVVFGVLFDISEGDKATLDKIEGLGVGYQQKTVQLNDLKGNIINATTYFATKTDPLLQPFSWYVKHVVFGAKEVGIPVSYINSIEVATYIVDPNYERAAKESAIYN